MLLWTTFLLAFSTLLPLINPLGSAIIFLGLIGDAPVTLLRSLARRIAINNIIFLAVFQILGAAILKFFGISLPIVQVSGGLVIAAIGWRMLNQKDAEAKAQTEQDTADASQDETTRQLQQKSFYPFTFPITSGPGTLVAVLTLSAHASQPHLADYVLTHVGLFLAIVLLSLMVYFCYAYAPRLASAVSQTTIHGILRVMSFLVLSIGIQIAWNGASQLILDLQRH